MSVSAANRKLGSGGQSTPGNLDYYIPCTLARGFPDPPAWLGGSEPQGTPAVPRLGSSLPRVPVTRVDPEFGVRSARRSPRAAGAALTSPGVRGSGSPLSSPHFGRISRRRGFVSFQKESWKAKAKTREAGLARARPRVNAAAHGRALWTGRAVRAPEPAQRCTATSRARCRQVPGTPA